MIDMDNSIQPKKEKISGLVITFNEEKNIAGCIESLKCICDDIVVVDSFSQDRTVDIARSMGATVILQKFLGDGPQRTKGVDYCLHDWIFNLDADERLEDDAIQAIKELSLDSSEVDVYELNDTTILAIKLLCTPASILIASHVFLIEKQPLFHPNKHIQKFTANEAKI